MNINQISEEVAVHEKNSELFLEIGIEPLNVWYYFNEYYLNKIMQENPYQYLSQFAIEKKFRFKADINGNFLLSIPPTKGKENVALICLHSKLFDNTSLKSVPFIASRTELKGDNSQLKAELISISIMLGIVTEKNLEHGPIELLFTREPGKINPRFIQSKKIINLNAINWGEIIISCTGATKTTGHIPLDYPQEILHDAMFRINIEICDSPIKKLAEFLELIKYSTLLVDIGGNENNAYAILNSYSEYEDRLKEIKSEFFDYYRKNGQTLKISIDKIRRNHYTTVRSREDLELIIASIKGLPNEVRNCNGKPEASVSIQNIHLDNRYFILETLQKNYSDEEIPKMNIGVKKIFSGFMAHTSEKTIALGWKEKANSSLVKMFTDQLDISCGKSFYPLPCGELKQALPAAEIIALGPTINNVGTDEEGIEIETVKKLFDLIIQVLKN